MSWSTEKLSVVAPSKPLKVEGIRGEQAIWQLNLNHIESNTGKLIEREIQPYSEAGNSTHWFDERYVLFSKLRPYLNKVILPNQKGLGTTELVPMLPDKNRLDRNYLARYLRSRKFVDWISVQTAGAKMPRVSMKTFWEHKIPLPPLAEQQKIAAILDAADSLRQKDQQLIEHYTALSQSLFLEMFGDPVSNPMGWELSRIDTLCSIVRGSSPRPKGDPRYYGGNVPRLMVADLTRDGKNVIPKIDFLTEEGAKKSRPTKSGTVVMTVSGNVGLTSMLLVDACIHDGFIAFNELKTDVLLPNFFVDLMMFLKSTHASRQAGAIFKNLTTSQIKEMEIPLPPMTLQNQFAERIQAIEAQKQQAQASLEKSETLFNSLLQRAFKGELTV